MVHRARTAKFGVVIAIVATTFWWTASAPSGQRDGVSTPTTSAKVALPEAVDGTASCSARGCHGGTAPHPASDTQRIGQNEYTVWVTRDRHAHAYEVLGTPLAGQISRVLARATDNYIPPKQDPRCLACHSSPAKIGGGQIAWNPYGVGCEACHGQPEKWKYAHTTWGPLDLIRKQQAYADSGMVWLRDVGNRAKACVGCHIGAPAEGDWPVRDMNHDMIAGGHPRLQFDLRLFLEAMPEHWYEKNTDPALGLRLWAVGQWLGAEASLRLLKDRADDKSRPWPEISENSCYGCHHGFAVNDYRRAPDGPRGGGIGLPPWGVMYFDQLATAAELGGPMLVAESKGYDGLIAELRRELQKPLPNREWVGEKAAAALKLMRPPPRAFAANELKADRRAALERDVINRWKGPRDWEAAVQLYFALSAFDAQSGASSRTDELLRALHFPEDRNSPTTYDPRAVKTALDRRPAP